MAEFLIPSFKYGLDTRREQLSSVVGTAVTLENAYVNGGGDVVKRGRFTNLGDFSIIDSASQVSMILGQFVGTTFYVFGSALPNGTTPTQSQPVQGVVPNYVTATIYQQLKHPTLVNDTSISYDAAKHLMTRLDFSDVYNDKVIAVACFADGNQFLYYDGTHVQQSSNGLVLYGRNTVSDLSDDLDRQFGTIGWETVANVDENAAAQAGSTMVKSPVADYFGGDLTVRSTAGGCGMRQFPRVDEDVEGTKAVAKFSITNNAGTFQVQAPAQSTATTPLVDLCGGAVTAAGSATLTATAIATAINDFSSDHGYTATSDEINVLVYAPLGYDISPDTFELTVTETGDGTTGGSSSTGTALTTTIGTNIVLGETALGRASFANGILTMERYVGLPTGSYRIRGQVTITAAGGTPTYTYAWSEADTGSAGGLTPTSGSGFNFTPEIYLTPNTQATGSFKCLVSDSSVPQLTSVQNITFLFICTYKEGL